MSTLFDLMPGPTLEPAELDEWIAEVEASLYNAHFYLNSWCAGELSRLLGEGVETGRMLEKPELLALFRRTREAMSS